MTVLVLAMLLGVPIGLVSGYFGGRVDALLMRLSDVFLAFPPLLLPIAITAALGAGLFNAMLALAIAVAWRYPLNREVHRAIRRELAEKRAQRQLDDVTT